MPRTVLEVVISLGLRILLSPLLIFAFLGNSSTAPPVGMNVIHFLSKYLSTAFLEQPRVSFPNLPPPHRTFTAKNARMI